MLFAVRIIENVYHGCSCGTYFAWSEGDMIFSCDLELLVEDVDGVAIALRFFVGCVSEKGLEEN
jgi:hypothetical protein